MLLCEAFKVNSALSYWRRWTLNSFPFFKFLSWQRISSTWVAQWVYYTLDRNKNPTSQEALSKIIPNIGRTVKCQAEREWEWRCSCPSLTLFCRCPSRLSLLIQNIAMRCSYGLYAATCMTCTETTAEA